MTWAPIGFRGKVVHAPGVDPRGGRWISPPIILCTNRERLEGQRVAMFDSRVTCKLCLKKLAALPEKARLK